MNDSTNSAQNPLARSIQQVSDVYHGPPTETLAPRPYSRCGAIDRPALVVTWLTIDTVAHAEGHR